MLFFISWLPYNRLIPTMLPLWVPTICERAQVSMLADAPHVVLERAYHFVSCNKKST